MVSSFYNQIGFVICDLLYLMDKINAEFVCEITIIDENDDFLVVDKPINISIQDEPDVIGLISLLKKQCGYSSLHPVHRLDKVTSGLLLVAKHSSANKELSRLFSQKLVSKDYLAITRTRTGGKAKKKQGNVSGDMVCVRNGSWKLLRTHHNPAKTYFCSESIGERYRLCWLKPITGKTHQIRVAMKSIAMPIVGDDRYGGDTSDRTYLHAYRLKFSLNGKEFNFESAPNFGEKFLSENFRSGLRVLERKVDVS